MLSTNFFKKRPIHLKLIIIMKYLIVSDAVWFRSECHADFDDASAVLWSTEVFTLFDSMMMMMMMYMSKGSVRKSFEFVFCQLFIVFPYRHHATCTIISTELQPHEPWQTYKHKNIDILLNKSYFNCNLNKGHIN